MNYQKIYNDIISRGQLRGLKKDPNLYTEKHHIIPKCIGGDNSHSNLVLLTASEHFVVHQLLIKIYPNNRKMVYSARMMTIDKSGKRSSNKLYSWLKKQADELNRMPCSEERKAKISLGNKLYWASRPELVGPPRPTREQLKEFRPKKIRKPFTEERNKKVGLESKKRWANPEIREKMLSAHIGKKRSEESKLRMSIAQKKRFGTYNE